MNMKKPITKIRNKYTSSVAAAESNRKTVASQSHAAYIAMLALGRLIFPFPAPNAIGVSFSLRTVT